VGWIGSFTSLSNMSTSQIHGKFVERPLPGCGSEHISLEMYARSGRSHHWCWGPRFRTFPVSFQHIFNDTRPGVHRFVEITLSDANSELSLFFSFIVGPLSTWWFSVSISDQRRRACSPRTMYSIFSRYVSPLASTSVVRSPDSFISGV
jgi:hypothetical protein